MSESCPFCGLNEEEIVAQTERCVAFRDGYPVSIGHTLIIPRRHVASFRDLTAEEWADMHMLAKDQAQVLMEKDGRITGFNFGFNDGPDAGQSVFHCHAHLIPRRPGDHPSPRGGIRGVMPNKAHYDIRQKPARSEL